MLVKTSYQILARHARVNPLQIKSGKPPQPSLTGRMRNPRACAYTALGIPVQSGLWESSTGSDFRFVFSQPCHR
jgi:hypothetical protein